MSKRGIMRIRYSAVVIVITIAVIVGITAVPAVLLAEPSKSHAPASTGEPVAPLDHATTKKAVMDAIRGTGVGNPLSNTEPVRFSYFQSSTAPEDTYYFFVGCNGKVYGKGQKLPKGRPKVLAVTIGFWDDMWTCNAVIGHNVGKYDEIDAIGGESMQHGELLPSDQGKGFDSEVANIARRRQFNPKDPFTAARAAIRDLYTSGYLYDPEKKFRESLDEADARLKPLIKYIDNRVKEIGSRYNWVPDNPAKKTLVEAFVKNGVSKQGLGYADSWSGWLSVTWSWFTQLGGGFYPAHRQALEMSLEAFRAQGYARQSDLISLERHMEEFKQTDEKVERLLSELVAAYAKKAKALDDTAKANDVYWSAWKQLNDQLTGKKISSDEYFSLIKSEEKRRDAALPPLKSKEDAAAAEIGRINDELKAIAEKRRHFQDIKKDPVRDDCEDAGI